MHKKSGSSAAWFLLYASGQTDRHTNHNTLNSSLERSKQRNMTKQTAK